MCVCVCEGGRELVFNFRRDLLMQNPKPTWNGNIIVSTDWSDKVGDGIQGNSG